MSVIVVFGRFLFVETCQSLLSILPSASVLGHNDEKAEKASFEKKNSKNKIKTKNIFLILIFSLATYVTLSYSKSTEIQFIIASICGFGGLWSFINLL